jgi:hypothetical protein
MYFLYKKGKVGYLIVPNVGLLTQLYQDFYDYFAKGFEKERDEFLNCIDKQGGGNKSDFNSFLTISTWQSASSISKKEIENILLDNDLNVGEEYYNNIIIKKKKLQVNLKKFIMMMVLTK